MADLQQTPMDRISLQPLRALEDSSCRLTKKFLASSRGPKGSAPQCFTDFERSFSCSMRLFMKKNLSLLGIRYIVGTVVFKQVDI